MNPSRDRPFVNIAQPIYLGAMYLTGQLWPVSVFPDVHERKFITIEQIDPVVSKNTLAVSVHIHTRVFCSFIFIFLQLMIMEIV